MENEKSKKPLPKLGRIFIPDERDKNYPLRAMLPRQASPLTYKYWSQVGWWGDQSFTSQCVAYAWIHFLEDGPVSQTKVPAPLFNPTEFYNRCQLNDEWPGIEPLYFGTSVRAGAEVLRQEGYIKEYRWTNNVEELVEALLTIGPVVVGTDWYSDMFTPDPKTGIVTATGANVGGHAYKLDGVNKTKKLLRIKNSWGRSWGKKGVAWISFDHFQKLLDANGECCIAIEVKK